MSRDHDPPQLLLSDAHRRTERQSRPALLPLGLQGNTQTMHGDEEDVFDSVTWESASAPYDVDPRVHPSGPGFKQSTAGLEEPRGPHDPKWEGHLITMVKDPVKELAETKDAYVSYLVTAKVCDPPHFVCFPYLLGRKTNLPIFSSPNPSSRRRFTDFVFMRDHLVKDFPACVVPALPDKHRLGMFCHRMYNTIFNHPQNILLAIDSAPNSWSVVD